MSAGLWIGLAVVCAGLWSGLLLTITTILHPMYAALDPRGLAIELSRFLPTARTSPTNYVLVIGLMLTPIGALVALRDDVSGAPFVWMAIGLALVLIGPFAASRWFAEPNYDVILGWDPDDVPEDWRRIRRTYFTLNWVRGAFTWAAFACFLAASYAHYAS
jgi:hypothetical protein